MNLATCVNTDKTGFKKLDFSLSLSLISRASLATLHFCFLQAQNVLSVFPLLLLVQRENFGEEIYFLLKSARKHSNLYQFNAIIDILNVFTF